LPWQRPLVQAIGNICILSTTTQTHLITNCLVNIVHKKPVNSNCSPKLIAMATSLSTYGPQSNTWFLRPIRAQNPNVIPIGSAVFAQRTVECPYTLQWDAHSLPKICPLPWGIWTPSNTWFLGSTEVLNPNGSSIGAAVFAGLTSVTDRQADRRTDRQTTLLGR